MRRLTIDRELDEVALKAAAKKARYGEDVDLDRYKEGKRDLSPISDLNELGEEERRTLMDVGIQEEGRSGSYLQFDSSVLLEAQAQEGVEVMSIKKAIEKYDWLREYWWKAVAVDQDKFTAYSQLHEPGGYFIRAKPYAVSEFPAQSCLYMKSAGSLQNVHNIIIAEEGSKLDVITGCAIGEKTEDALHIGISEFFVKKDATLSFTMIHSWGEGVTVRPRSGAIIEENGTFFSNYVNMRRTKSIQMYPTAYCVGPNSMARYSTVLVAREESKIDVGSRSVLKAPRSRTEMISRAIGLGGEAYIRGGIEGESEGVKGHLECRGLMLRDEGFIYSIPELKATLQNLDLSHEAAIGKIAEDEIFYLMTRGLSEDEATSAIVRGFLNVEIKGLPKILDEEIRRTIEASLSSML
jgi:hypothetical protein